MDLRPILHIIQNLGCYVPTVERLTEYYSLMEGGLHSEELGYDVL